MIIPANESVADQLAQVPLQIRMVIDDLDYHLRKTCDDDIIVFQIKHDEAIFDLPRRSKENGAIKLVDILNEIWIYSPDNKNKKVARIDRDKKGWFFVLEISPETTNLSKDYLRKVVKIKKGELQ